MADIRSDAAVRGPSFIIDMLSQIDVDYWCQIFGVSPAHLREAVHHAGHEAVDVARYLRSKGSAGPAAPPA